MSRVLRVELAGYAIAALAIVATVVLVATHNAVPNWFEAIAVFGVGGSTGALLPGQQTPPTGGNP